MLKLDLENMTTSFGLNSDKDGLILQDLAKAAQLELARRDPNAFAELCFQDKDGSPWVQSDFHREWHNFLPPPDGRQHLLLIEAAREHAKTTQIAVARTIWELGKNHNLRIKIVTGEDELGKDILNEITQNLEQNKKIHAVFPDLKPDKSVGWTKHKIYVQRPIIQKDASVHVASILSSGVGGRADLLIFDDVVNQRNAVYQPALRQVVKSTFREVWMNLLTDDGRAIYIFTPWHTDDLSHELKRDLAWTLWSKPAIIDGEPLWGVKWTLFKLEQRRLGIGDRAFQRQFMLIALSAEETTFSKEVVDKSIRRDKTLGEVYPRKWPRYGGIDLASSLGKKASYTVIFTVAVDPDDGKRYPEEIIRRKVKFPELVKLIEDRGNVHQWDLVFVENNSFQEALVTHLEDKKRGLAIEGFHTGSQKWDELLGLPGLAAEMDNGGWIIPKGCSGCGQSPCMCHRGGCDCVVCAWERELRYHPVAETADIVMAQWLCGQAIRKNMRRDPREFLDLGGIWRDFDKQRAT